MISSKSNYNPTIGTKKGVSRSRKETPFFEVSSCVIDLFYFTLHHFIYFIVFDHPIFFCKFHISDNITSGHNWLLSFFY